jgi:hypothetical protein
VKRLQRPMPEVSGSSRRAGRAGLLSAERLRRWKQDTTCHGEHKDVSPVDHVGHGRVSGWGRRVRGWGVGAGMVQFHLTNAPAALLVAAGVVVVDGAALRGFAGWLLRRTSEEPSNRGVPRRDRVRRADGACSCWLSPVAQHRQKRWAFGVGDLPQLLELGVAYQMASGFWARRHAARVGMCGGAACAVLGPSSSCAGPVVRLSCGAS